MYFLLALLSFFAPALADEAEPPSGTGAIITGSILTGVGALNLVSAPVCVLDAYGDLVGSDGQTACLVGSLVLGGGLLAVGVPELIIGVRNRKRHQEWLGAHAEAHLGFTTTGRGGVVWLQGSF